MAKRPVFVSILEAPYCKNANVDFTWVPGFAKSQKQKCIRSLHDSFLKKYPKLNVLEISSKSFQGGEVYSAFYLKKYVPSLKKFIPVENVFQASKVFENGGPYVDLLGVTPKEAKKDPRLKGSKLIGFRFEGKDFPLNPKTAFYDYIYMSALLENKDLVDNLVKYDAFTDIEFNPNKSINCQAKAASEFVSLYRLGLTDKIKDFDKFVKIVS